jgi:hypothetical protein
MRRAGEAVNPKPKFGAVNERDELATVIQDALDEGLTTGREPGGRERRAANALLAAGWRKRPTREQVESVVDTYEREAAEGHCDCGNYSIDTDRLVARLWALMEGGDDD